MGNAVVRSTRVRACSFGVQCARKATCPRAAPSQLVGFFRQPRRALPCANLSEDGCPRPSQRLPRQHSDLHHSVSRPHLRLLHHVPNEQNMPPEIAQSKARVESAEAAEKRNHRAEQKPYRKPAKQRVNQKSAQKPAHGTGTRLKAQLLRRANADESQPLLDSGVGS